MRTVLAIDTSAGTSVAVVRGGSVLSELSTDEIRRHAEVIGDLISQCLTDAGITPADVTDVVAGRGPGPFTGLRVGIAAAIAFAVGRGIPVHGVPSHDGVAWGHDGPCAVITDARRREIAVTCFTAGGESRAALGPILTTEGTLAGLVDLVAYPELRAASISAAGLGLRAEHGLNTGEDFTDCRALYLRAPDAVPSNGPKKVLG
ncbi:MAG: tRNA (adenosine(37)-N6)-threonylcarbamoyltransferase complex dimerization subunit type 1 TsaB [Microbacteriaceae bacterium]